MHEKLNDVLRLIDAAHCLGSAAENGCYETDNEEMVLDVAADIVCNHVLGRTLTVDETTEFRGHLRALLALPDTE